jgi:hypothetical protein
MSAPMQTEFALPPRLADDIIREHLAALVAEFNAVDGDPERRCELYREIVRLRGLIGGSL